MRVITGPELKAKIDRHDDFRLVMAMDQWHFEALRIPGSTLVANKKDALKLLGKDDEIVVYCSDEACFISRSVADFMERSGYTNVLHYPGGLHDWMDSGFPLEGSMASENKH